MNHILVFFGTRPEAIKMIPVIKALRENKFQVTVGLSGQHNEMVTEIFDLFQEKADFSLQIQNEVKNTEDVISLVVPRLCAKLRQIKPDLILVHGDTSSTLAGALAGFYEKIPVGHVEAGLRSGNRFHPWPEEMNRKLTASLAVLHFAPTKQAEENLLKEGIHKNTIHMVGNTVIDALFLMKSLNDKKPKSFEEKFKFLDTKKKWILVTGHRRENLGQGLHSFMQALLELAKRDDVEIIFPVHPNPKVRASFAELIQPNCPIHLINPLPYDELVWVLSKSKLVITDSGGLQEEAPSFKVPVVVTREVTERIESLEKGWAVLAGTDQDKILQASKKFLNSQNLPCEGNPYGDGTTSKQIAKIIESSRFETKL